MHAASYEAERRRTEHPAAASYDVSPGVNGPLGIRFMIVYDSVDVNR
jgi:hypothetical protein